MTEKRLSYYVEKSHKLKFFENLQKINDYEVDQLEWASQIKPRTGNTIPVELNVFRTHDATEQLHWSIQDISHLIAKERAEQLAQIHDFIAILMHDLKVPLLGIRMVVQNLPKLNEYDTSDRENTYKILEKANNQVIVKVEDLLEAYKLSADCKSQITEHEIETFSLNQLVADCVKNLKAQTLFKNIKIEANLETEVEMLANRDQIQKVLICLLDNAIKHSPTNETVYIQAYNEDNDIVVAVTDSGEGIKLKDRKKLFNQFWHGKSRKIPNSSGLGLFICKQIIELHGGSINCESASEKGSRFLFKIPQVANELTV